jgi:arsenic resistance protein ArsH
MKDMPNLDNDCFQVPTTDSVFRDQSSTHKPRILLLYGSLRQRSFSRLVVAEAARLLEDVSCRWPAAAGQ